jgi:hypothetical protein
VQETPSAQIGMTGRLPGRGDEGGMVRQTPLAPRLRHARGGIESCQTIKHQSFIERSRNALLITDTELRLMAAPAIIGLSRRPKNG